MIKKYKGYYIKIEYDNGCYYYIIYQKCVCSCCGNEHENEIDLDTDYESDKQALKNAKNYINGLI